MSFRLGTSSSAKMQVVVQAFWPQLFHAAGISHCTEATIGRLRAKAVRALGHGKAGASPLIRLSWLGISCFWIRVFFGCGSSFAT